MAKFLSKAELYAAIKQKSSQTRQMLWACSATLGMGAHRVFSQDILKNSLQDVRFVFPLTEATVKEGQVSPREIQFLQEHIEGSAVKTQSSLNANLYIFDDSAFMTSAGLTEATLDSDTATGVMLTEPEEINQIREFFNLVIWQNAKSIGDLKKFKKTYNTAQKNNPTKTKTITESDDWSDTCFQKWYIGVLRKLPRKVEGKVKVERSWSTKLLLVGDVGYKAFKLLKLGDIAYLFNVFKKVGGVEVQLVRVQDKDKVETDEGDFHLLCQVEKNYLLPREQFQNLLNVMGVHSRNSEVPLNDQQLTQLTQALESIKTKRKSKKTKNKTALNPTQKQSTTITKKTKKRKHKTKHLKKQSP